MLFCNIPFTSPSVDERNSRRLPFNLAHIFEILNEKKEQKVIESYSLTQTTLEQIFVQLAGEDEDNSSDTGGNNDEQSKRVGYFIHVN